MFKKIWLESLSALVAVSLFVSLIHLPETSVAEVDTDGITPSTPVVFDALQYPSLENLSKVVATVLAAKATLLVESKCEDQHLIASNVGLGLVLVGVVAVAVGLCVGGLTAPTGVGAVAGLLVAVGGLVAMFIGVNMLISYDGQTVTLGVQDGNGKIPLVQVTNVPLTKSDMLTHSVQSQLLRMSFEKIASAGNFEEAHAMVEGMVRITQSSPHSIPMTSSNDSRDLTSFMEASFLRESASLLASHSRPWNYQVLARTLAAGVLKKNDSDTIFRNFWLTYTRAELQNIMLEKDTAHAITRLGDLQKVLSDVRPTLGEERATSLILHITDIIRRSGKLEQGIEDLLQKMPPSATAVEDFGWS